jgi:hypothetical protein
MRPVDKLPSAGGANARARRRGRRIEPSQYVEILAACRVFVAEILHGACANTQQYVVLLRKNKQIIDNAVLNRPHRRNKTFGKATLASDHFAVRPAAERQRFATRLAARIASLDAVLPQVQGAAHPCAEAVARGAPAAGSRVIAVDLSTS